MATKQKNISSAIVELLFLIAFSVLGYLVGIIFGYSTLGLFMGMLSYIVYLYRRIIRVFIWLPEKELLSAPENAGILEPIIDEIYLSNRFTQNALGQLQQMSQKTNQIFNVFQDAIVILDNKLRILWWNQAAESLVGLNPDFDRFKMIIWLIRNPEFQAFMQQQAEDNSNIIFEDIFNDGQVHRFIRQRCSTDETILVIRNITENFKLNQMRKDFVGNVSHELRTPLTVISGYVENLQAYNDKAGHPLPTDAFEQMSLHTHRMEFLIQDLLSLSKLESEKPQQHDEVIDVDQLIDSCIIQVANLNQNKQHNITKECNSNRKLIGSYDEMVSLLTNLISNAIKYTPNNGKITIRWLEQKQQSLLQVKDNGIGLDANQIPRITERFYRVDPSRNNQTGGTGLGLAIVKHILIRHKAQLNIYSRPNQGSTFSCQFPIEQTTINQVNTPS